MLIHTKFVNMSTEFIAMDISMHLHSRFAPSDPEGTKLLYENFVLTHQLTINPQLFVLPAKLSNMLNSLLYINYINKAQFFFSLVDQNILESLGENRLNYFLLNYLPNYLIGGENLFRNFSFVFLFFAMLDFWCQFAFSYKTSLKPGKFLLFVANISLIILLLLRWNNSGHFPLSNLYESLMFLSWSCTMVYFVLLPYNGLQTLWVRRSITPSFFKVTPTDPEGGYGVGPKAPNKEGRRAGSEATDFALGTGVALLDPLKLGAGACETTTTHCEAAKSPKKREQPRVILECKGAPSQRENLQENILGCIITPCALLMNAYATFSLPKEMQEISPLVPALQSNWLMMHVTVMILSYAALILGSLLSMAFLIVSLFSLNRVKLAGFKNWGPSPAQHPKGYFYKRETQMFIVDNLENFSYRLIGIGFSFLTIGILSGAVWANEAWGSYWSWDPKETWAFLTWLVYAIYLHTRITKGWEGQKPAILASIGFFTVWICFLGVNLIGEGLHSYGWFIKNAG
nr:heme attachment to plastid cytochrome c [Palmellopsis texensis]